MLNYSNKYIAVLQVRAASGKEVLTGNILGCYDDEKTALAEFFALGPKAVVTARRQAELNGESFIFAHLYLYAPAEKGAYSPKPHGDIIEIDFAVKNGKLV